VVPGTSTITITPPGATSCTLDQPITDWRIDPDVFTRAVANCQ
jgi:hypothetical protein